jgi:ferredoxin
MTFIEVNQQTCGQDGLCSAVCPAKLINFSPGEYPTPIAEAEGLCLPVQQLAPCRVAPGQLPEDSARAVSKP